MHYIIIDCDQEEPVVTITEDEAFARGFAAGLIAHQAERHGLQDAIEDIDILKAPFSESTDEIQDLGNLMPGVLTASSKDEGELGLVMCFSTSDRSNFLLPWPAKGWDPDNPVENEDDPEQEWLGNGYAYVFNTKAKPPGIYKADKVHFEGESPEEDA